MTRTSIVQFQSGLVAAINGYFNCSEDLTLILEKRGNVNFFLDFFLFLCESLQNNVTTYETSQNFMTEVPIMFATTKNVNLVTDSFRAFALCAATVHSIRKNPALKILKKKKNMKNLKQIYTILL